MKKITASIFLIVACTFCIGATDTQFVIEAEDNANIHNNRALLHLNEGYYYGAIKELNIAINLNPETQAAAVYYNNLGLVYMKIMYPAKAQPCFENAIKRYPLNFEYYKNLVACYKAQNTLSAQLSNYEKNKKSVLDKLMIALIYGESGEISREITILDEFCEEEPDLLITPAVKKHINKRVKELKTF